MCSVPLLDMRRYHLLLAGASWMAEYGDPDDPAEWAFISEYSPVPERLGRRATTRRSCSPPRPATTACTPAMPARWPRRCESTGHPVLYYENIEGGHGGAADNAQSAFKTALAFAFLWRMLGT